ncbi:hypothetical protein [Candidatus Bandiella euplotis]|uniref:Uncharacterized protein n=1 Tax=Candidatus Bandiella euplotis TaxID=1664265 RepID=A0ABZ0UQ29_9RICK|nr:hypothetical protein [Candidatus Bandiella woodruffii]WPX96808.1 hypothetical protein Bandiella_00936 [Candidatus Bandiella woodruffii]
MTTLSKTLKIKSPVKKRYTNETSGIEVEYQHSPQLLIHYDIIEDINYHSLKCFDASKLLSTSFKVITPFNVAKIYVKNEDGGYFEIAKVEILKSENQLNILNTTDRTFKVELDAKVIFNLAEALKYSAVLSNEEKRIFEEDFKQLGQHKLYLTMHFAYNVDKYDNRSEISRFFNAQTLNFAIKYGNNMFGWTVDGVRVSANNANHQVVLTNYTQLLDYIKKVSILHSKDPSVLFFFERQ